MDINEKHVLDMLEAIAEKSKQQMLPPGEIRLAKIFNEYIVMKNVLCNLLDSISYDDFVSDIPKERFKIATYQIYKLGFESRKKVII